MALTDTQIRQNLVKALQLIEKDIEDFELPLSQYGCQSREYFARKGTFGKKSGHERHWVASIVISDDKTDIDKIYQFVCGETK